MVSKQCGKISRCRRVASDGYSIEGTRLGIMPFWNSSQTEHVPPRRSGIPPERRTLSNGSLLKLSPP